MNRFRLPAAMLALLCLHSGTSAAATFSESNEVLSGDIITAIVPLLAYGTAHYKDDGEGEGQFFRSVGASLIVNTALRVAFNQTSWGERPNGSPYGFPSGHVAFMTSNAAFLQDRFGWKFGVPAYVLTAYVAWVRVDTDHHRWRDVAAGAAVSYGISKLFVTPHDATHIAPIVGPDFLGMRWERSF